MHQLIMQEFPETEMIMLPQTVFFRSEERKRQASQIYNQHRRLLFFARDPVSEGLATVSYTHLDVYKRQHGKRLDSCIGQIVQRGGVTVCSHNANV